MDIVGLVELRIFAIFSFYILEKFHPFVTFLFSYFLCEFTYDYVNYPQLSTTFLPTFSLPLLSIVFSPLRYFTIFRAVSS